VLENLRGKVGGIVTDNGTYVKIHKDDFVKTKLEPKCGQTALFKLKTIDDELHAVNIFTAETDEIYHGIIRGSGAYLKIKDVFDGYNYNNKSSEIFERGRLVSFRLNKGIPVDINYVDTYPHCQQRGVIEDFRATSDVSGIGFVRHENDSTFFHSTAILDIIIQNKLQKYFEELNGMEALFDLSTAKSEERIHRMMIPELMPKQYRR